MKRVVFRVDASIQIGTGHVMRCLTLADALASNEVSTLFICREHIGHLEELIRRRGHEVVLLSNPRSESAEFLGEGHESWLGVNWTVDAEQTLEAIGQDSVDLLIVDHYALDSRWELVFRPKARRIMVIDDLADRPHASDVLLDQNLGRAREDYNALISPSTKALIGPNYALLRPEFAIRRDHSLTRREPVKLRNILVSMGGVDQFNLTEQVLEALNNSMLHRGIKITVVMGSQAPSLQSVKQRAATMMCETEVLVGVSNMAELISESDLAIGAAGSTTLERFCLGVPSLLVKIAANQALLIKGASDCEVAHVTTVENLDQDVSRVLDWFQASPQAVVLMSRKAAALVDGSGVMKVVKQLSLGNG